MYIKRFKEEKRKIIDTDHSLERYILRYHNVLNKEKIDNLIYNVSEDIIKDYDDKEGKYGWHSKSTGAGGLINWRHDYKNNDNKNHAIIVSLFPIKKFHTFHNVDAVIIIEKHIIEWAKEKGKLLEFKKNLCESYYDEKKDNNDEIYVNFFEGKLYDFKLDGYILIK